MPANQGPADGSYGPGGSAGEAELVACSALLLALRERACDPPVHGGPPNDSAQLGQRRSGRSLASRGRGGNGGSAARHRPDPARVRADSQARAAVRNGRSGHRGAQGPFMDERRAATLPRQGRDPPSREEADGRANASLLFRRGTRGSDADDLLEAIRELRAVRRCEARVAAPPLAVHQRALHLRRGQRCSAQRAGRESVPVDLRQT